MGGDSRLARALLPVVGAALLVACDGDRTGPSSGLTAAFAADCTLLACTFNNGSADPDGSIQANHWDFGDGNRARTTRNAAHTYAAPGEFTVTLTVTDDDGNQASATRRVAVADPPTADFGATCMTMVCTFTDASSTPRGSLAGWLWDFGDGATSRDRNPNHTYQLAGPTQIEVTLTVTDQDGETATVTRRVSVGWPPQEPPLAAFNVSCSGLVCTFTDRSTSPTDVLNIWEWDFGDGQSKSSCSPLCSREDEVRNPVHAYDVTAPTRFTVTLRVCDSNISCDSASEDIIVTPGD